MRPHFTATHGARASDAWGTRIGVPAARVLGLSVLAAMLMVACKPGDHDTIIVEDPGEITAPPELQDVNVEDFHLNITAETDSDLCVACHGDMTSRTTWNPSVAEFHAFKHEVLPYGCTDCHGAVNLVNKSGANLRKQVDVEAVCAPCHGPGGEAPQLYQTGGSEQ